MATSGRLRSQVDKVLKDYKGSTQIGRDFQSKKEFSGPVQDYVQYLIGLTAVQEAILKKLAGEIDLLLTEKDVTKVASAIKDTSNTLGAS